METKQIEPSYLHNCKNALNKQGVLVINICHIESDLVDELDRLLAIEFENRILKFEVKGGNSIIIAFKNDIPVIERNELLSKGKYLQEKMGISMEEYAELLWDTQNV